MEINQGAIDAPQPPCPGGGGGQGDRRRGDAEVGHEAGLQVALREVRRGRRRLRAHPAAGPGPRPPPARAPAPPLAPAQSAARSRPITAPPVAPAPSAPDVLGDLALGPDEPAVGLPPIELEEPEAPAPVRVSAAAPAVVPAARPAKVREHDPQGTLVTNRSEADEIRRRIANPGMVELEMDLEEVDEPEVGRLPPPAPSPRSRGPSPAAPAEFEVPLEIEVPPGATHAVVRLKLVVRLKRR